MTRWTHAASRAANPPSPPSLPLRRRLLALSGLLAGAALLALSAGAARAQEVRAFPDHALRGRIQAQTPPAVRLNGKDDLLAMGARIRDTRNLFVTSGTLADGNVHLVNYTRNGFGQISEVWMLTPEEAAIRRPSVAPRPAN